MRDPSRFGWARFGWARSGGGETASLDAAPALEVARSWEAVFAPPARAAFEAALRAWLLRRRWFRTKTKRVYDAYIAEAFPFAGARVALVEVALEDGARDTYAVPLAFVTGAELARLRVLRPYAVVAPLSVVGPGVREEGAVLDALALESFLLELLGAVDRGATVDADGASLRFVPRGLLTPSRTDLHARMIDAEQTNTSILYGDMFVAKLLRRLDAGESADLEVGRFLADVGFRGVPALLGWAEVQRRGEVASTLALVHAFVPNQGGAWEHALSTIDAFLANAAHRDAPPPALPDGGVLARAARLTAASVEAIVGPYAALVERLGERIGELHAALASRPGDPTFAPEPFGVDQRREIVRAVRRDLDAAFALLSADRTLPLAARATFAHVASVRATIDARLERAESLADAGAVIRVHGDLHLGQLLFTGDDFVVLDFDGDPTRPLAERKAKRSPLVDVAAMLRSFHYAVTAAVRRRPESSRAAVGSWATWLHKAIGALFVRGWLAKVEDAGILPVDRRARAALLDLFLVEKAVDEVDYELELRPDWVEIPLEGLRDLALSPDEGAAVVATTRGVPALVDARALAAFHDGHATHAHDVLGAHADADGATFVVWAPRAYGVSIVGEWDGANAQPLARVDERGVFAARVAAARAGHRYTLRVSTPDGASVEKADPFARVQENGAASVIADLSYAWTDDAWMAARRERARRDRPMSIYEVHLGSWRRADDGKRSLGYREIAEPLAAHASALGFTHVEIMPVMEHPFYGSWGYGVTGFFAATQRYGAPDDLAYLVDVLHGKGLGVILDWVPAHFALDPHGLARFDGAPLFEPDDPARAVHPTWKTGLFDYAKPEVRSFLASSATYWIEAFHADGLRVDGVESILYRDHGREDGRAGDPDAEGVGFLRELTATLKRDHPDVWLIAEDASAWPGVTRSPEVGGLGFDLKWDMGFSNDMRRYLAVDPFFRSHHQGELTFRSVYASSESFVLPLSHDDVAAGRGGALVEQMHGDDWQKLANLRLLYASLHAQPGKKLLFMGSELAPPHAWNHDASLDWSLAEAPPHDGVLHLVRDLNRLHRELPALHARDDVPEGFSWVDGTNAAMSVVVWLRRGPRPDDLVLCAFNFTPVPRFGYRIGVPRGGLWREVLNTDAREYGGSGHGNLGGAFAVPYPWNEQPHSIVVTLPPLAALYFAL